MEKQERVEGYEEASCTGEDGRECTVEEGKSELDKVLEGSSYELGLYISNEVLRGEVRRLRDVVEGLEAEVIRLDKVEWVEVVHGGN